MLLVRIHVCLFLCFDFIPLHTVIICEEGRDDCPSHTAYVRRSCNLGLRRLLCSWRGILWAEQLRSPGVSLLNTVLCSTSCERAMDGDDFYIQNLGHPGRHHFLKGTLPWADGHFFSSFGMLKVKFTLTYEPHNLPLPSPLVQVHLWARSFLYMKDTLFPHFPDTILSRENHPCFPFRAVTTWVYFHWMYSILKHL